MELALVNAGYYETDPGSRQLVSYANTAAPQLRQRFKYLSTLRQLTNGSVFRPSDLSR